MKKVCSLLILFTLVAASAPAAELLAPGDMIIAVDADGLKSFSSYPAAESPDKILDGDAGTKYLNFAGNRYNTGFIVTPTASSVVQSFQITTANDASSRDPISYVLYGTNDAITSADNSRGISENWTMIGSGSLSLPDDRFALGSVVNLTNNTAFTSYKMMFPLLKSANGAGLMQISEVDFFDGLDGTGNDLLTLGSVLAVQDTQDSHYPTAESPSKMLDGDASTKFLNFGKDNTGFIVTPSGTAPVKGFQITTANDWSERDPASWILYGTNDAITSGDNTEGTEENWVEIDAGTLALPDDRLTEGGIVVVDNDTAYTSYKMLFPTLKNADATNSMQIAEIQFYDVPEPATMALLTLGGLLISRRRK